MTDEIRYLGAVRKLKLGPNDIIVLDVKGPISNQDAERIKAYVSGELDNRKVLLISDGMKLGVLSLQE